MALKHLVGPVSRTFNAMNIVYFVLLGKQTSYQKQFLDQYSL